MEEINAIDWRGLILEEVEKSAQGPVGFICGFICDQLQSYERCRYL